jgi:2-polyprenyl-6-methoxyphenol hydroxylase-like FAD-dependent oxidoreductase
LLLNRTGNANLCLGKTVANIEQRDNEVLVTLNDGSKGAYDLVIGADGIQSGVRRLLFGEIEPHRTGWGGWLWWAPAGAIRPDDVTEYWGAGRFVGLYPTRDRICVFAGGPIKHATVPTGESRRAHVLSLFADLVKPLQPVFAALPAGGEEIFFWKLEDVRSPHWRQGRVVLLGDAATAFLPTAGVGASMALESAAVLADELLRVEAKTAERALRLYELRHRKRVEAIQSASRNLAKVALVGSTPLAWARDELMKHYSLENLVKSIMKSLDEPI